MTPKPKPGYFGLDTLPYDAWRKTSQRSVHPLTYERVLEAIEAYRKQLDREDSAT